MELGQKVLCAFVKNVIWYILPTCSPERLNQLMSHLELGMEKRPRVLLCPVGGGSGRETPCMELATQSWG